MSPAISDFAWLTASDRASAGYTLGYFAHCLELFGSRAWMVAFLGFSASLPWDRSERTVEFATVFTKLRGNHTIKVGEDLRHTRDFLLQTQDNGGPRGQFQFRAPQTSIPTDAAATAAHAWNSPSDGFAEQVLLTENRRQFWRQVQRQCRFAMEKSWFV